MGTDMVDEDSAGGPSSSPPRHACFSYAYGGRAHRHSRRARERKGRVPTGTLQRARRGYGNLFALFTQPSFPKRGPEKAGPSGVVSRILVSTGGSSAHLSAGNLARRHTSTANVPCAPCTIIDGGRDVREHIFLVSK